MAMKQSIIKIPSIPLEMSTCERNKFTQGARRGQTTSLGNKSTKSNSK